MKFRTVQLVGVSLMYDWSVDAECSACYAVFHQENHRVPLGGAALHSSWYSRFHWRLSPRGIPCFMGNAFGQRKKGI